MRNEKGFTLIELMVVVLIIGILVAIAIPVFVNASTKAKQNSCNSNLRTIDGALNTYEADTEQLAATGALTPIVPTYLRKEPKCPIDSGHTYTIAAGVSVSGRIGDVSCAVDSGPTATQHVRYTPR